MARIPRERQTLFFSATWPREVKSIASQFVTRATVHVFVGAVEEKVRCDGADCVCCVLLCVRACVWGGGGALGAAACLARDGARPVLVPIGEHVQLDLAGCCLWGCSLHAVMSLCSWPGRQQLSQKHVPAAAPQALLLCVWLPCIAGQQTTSAPCFLPFQPPTHPTHTRLPPIIINHSSSRTSRSRST